MNLYPLITLLSDGAYHTGTELGASLGISRTAVWKQIQKLPSLGLDFKSDKQRGYCLLAPLDLLQEASLIAKIQENASLLPAKVEVVPVICSTNAELLERANQGQSIHQRLLTAEVQIQGRGRRGRTWVSPFATSLSCSLGWQFEGSAQKLQGLSLAVGVVLVESLQRLGVAGLGLKWPNDIYLHGKKLGGILIEITGDLAGPCSLIIGYGLNVTPPSSQLNEPPDQPLAYLTEAQENLPDRNTLVASLYQAVAGLIADYGQEGFLPYRDAWNSLHVWKNREASVITPQATETVLLGEVNAMGELQVFDAQGQQKYLSSGEISLRAKN